jgi:hypothetical protein
MVPVLVSRHPLRSAFAVALIVALVAWAGVELAAICRERDPLTTTTGMDALIAAHLAKGASVDDIRQFLQDNGLDGGGSLQEAGDYSVLRDQGIDNNTFVLPVLGPSGGGWLVSCRPQTYFILDAQERLDRWIVRDVCTGP